MEPSYSQTQTEFDFHSVGGNEFAARATGGVRFVTGIDGSGNPVAPNTFVMTNAGNLGVGTNSPAFKINVVGIVDPTALQLRLLRYSGFEHYWSQSSKAP